MIRDLVTRFAAGLRFPTLFAIMAGLFLLDLLVPDLIPFADEILLAFGTVLLVMLFIFLTFNDVKRLFGG